MFVRGKTNEKSRSNTETMGDDNKVKCMGDTLLNGFLKTRYVNLQRQSKTFGFSLKSSWKLRYWRIVMTDEGVIFEKSRCAASKGYKSFSLSSKTTHIWESWGKRGDTKYCFGFVVRVGTKLQIEVALDSETMRHEWINTLRSALHRDQDGSGAIQGYTPSGTSIPFQPWAGTMAGICRVIKSDSLSNHCLEETRRNEMTNRRSFTSNCTDLSVDSTIPRRFNADLYDDEGYMSNNVEKHRLLRYTDNLPKIFDQETESEDEDKEETFVGKFSSNQTTNLDKGTQDLMELKPNPLLPQNGNSESSTQGELVSERFALPLPERSDERSVNITRDNSLRSLQTTSEISTDKSAFSLVSISSNHFKSEEAKMTLNLKNAQHEIDPK